ARAASARGISRHCSRRLNESRSGGGHCNMDWSPRLNEMEDALGKALPGHGFVIQRVAKAIRKSAALGGPTQTLGTFVLAGPPVIPQKLALGLAAFLFGHPGSVLRINMEEYSEKHMATRLIARNGGMVCSYIEGDLTGPITRCPHQVIL